MSNGRIGVVGAGNRGADHVTTLHRHVSGAVALVADIDRERAASAAGTVPGTRATDDPYVLIADPDVDAVVMASHDTTHADPSVAAVRAGKRRSCARSRSPRPSTSACGSSGRSGRPAAD
jgi:myo-inositol 2-dehydrogenase/D-chiro-inositol 1-dehydrogenase